MRRASDTTRGAAESYADVVRQRPAAGGPRKRLRLLATFGGRMHSSDWSRLLTERQREVLSIVVENKVYRNRDSKIPELAAQMGIAPAAVAKHLLEIEKTALLNVVVSPSEQGKRVYERLELEPRPEQKQTAEVLDRNTVTIPVPPCPSGREHDGGGRGARSLRVHDRQRPAGPDGRPADHEATWSRRPAGRAPVRIPADGARRGPRGAVPRGGDRVRPK